MVRTRRASSQDEGRRRPTASVWRGDRGASSSAPADGADAPVAPIAPVGFPDAGEVVGYPEEPSDVSLLVSYNHHVALRLWQGEVSFCFMYFLFSCYVWYMNFFMYILLFSFG